MIMDKVQLDLMFLNSTRTMSSDVEWWGVNNNCSVRAVHKPIKSLYIMEIDMGRQQCHLIRVQCTILRVYIFNVII